MSIDIKKSSKQLIIFLSIIIALLVADQIIKFTFISIAKPTSLQDFIMIAEGKIISLALVFNTGVAFSFLTSLGEWLKVLQVIFLCAMVAILFYQKSLFSQHYLPFAFMFGGGISNVLDRFLHGGVVDYIYWHYLFDFPIFNFADICIDCGIAIFVWQVLFTKNDKEVKPLS